MANKKLLIVSLSLLIALTMPNRALAWGPFAHTWIAADIAKQVAMTDNVAFISGNLMADVSLARVDSYPAGQAKFHARIYYDNLKALATTPELTSFAKGWYTHVFAGDVVEGPYSAERIAQGAPIHADDLNQGVEALIERRVQSITLTGAEVNLMIAAYQATYPNDTWQPTAEWIQVAKIAFNIYLTSPSSSAEAIVTARQWYGDYETYLKVSIIKSLDNLVKRGDAKRDGAINMGDVVQVQRIILGLSPVVPEADANSSGTVDMGDVIHIERMILGRT